MELANSMSHSTIPVAIVPGAIWHGELASPMSPSVRVGLSLILCCSILDVECQLGIPTQAIMFQLRVVVVNRISKINQIGFGRLPLIFGVAVVRYKQSIHQLLELDTGIQDKLKSFLRPEEPSVAILRIQPPIEEAINVLDIMRVRLRKL